MFSFHDWVPSTPKDNPDYFGGGFRIADVSLERMAKGICSRVWSPNIYEKGRRKKTHWLSADWLVLDFDDGETSLTQAVEMFCDMVHLIGTTASHQKEKKDKPACDRFRVVLKFEERITDLALYHHQLIKAENKYSVDPSCKDGARFFFPCQEIVSMSDDGYTVEIDHDAPPPPDYTRYTIARQRTMTIPRKWLIYLEHERFPDGQYNTTCYQLGAQLAPLGLSVEEICARIYASPTYKDAHLPSDLQAEIVQAVSNGHNRGLQELAQQPGT